MDKNTEQFQWTDKLVKEYTSNVIAQAINDRMIYPIVWDEQISKFKQSKSKKEEPQWEIMELRRPSDFDLIHCLKITDKRDIEKLLRVSPEEFKIYSVKRSDGEVFSVGDVIKVHNLIKPITSFELRNKTYIWCSIDDNNGYGSNLSVSEKAPKEEQVPIKVEMFLHVNGEVFREQRCLYNGLVVDNDVDKCFKRLHEHYNGKQIYTSEELLQARRDAFEAGWQSRNNSGYKSNGTYQEDFNNSLK